MTPRERLHALLLCSAITETVNRAKVDIAKLEEHADAFRRSVLGGDAGDAVDDGELIDSYGLRSMFPARLSMREELAMALREDREKTTRERVADAAKRIIEMEQ